MGTEEPTRAQDTGLSWLPRNVERLLFRFISAAEAASRGRTRQAIGVLVGLLVAAITWVGAGRLLVAPEGYGPLSLVALVVLVGAVLFVCVSALTWTFVMLAFLLTGRRWSSVIAAPFLYWAVGVAYMAGGPILTDVSYGGGDPLWLTAFMWPMYFVWAELGCGLHLGLCPN